MSGQLHRLSARGAVAATKPGRHSDGGGLNLVVRPDGRRSWSFIFRWHGRRREAGLGSFLPTNSAGQTFDHVTLAQAREKAAEMRVALAAGRDPIVARKASSVPTFGEFADELIDDIAGEFRNEKHRAQWRSTLSDTYCRSIRKLPINAVATDDVLAVLKPLWQRKQETASRIRGRIERVLSAAKAKGLREGENPAAWRGHLDHLLPKRQKLTRGHLAAMPYAAIPEFMQRLMAVDTVAARALEFTVLLAARSGEVLGARWSEFDLDAAIWTVPAERMKAGVPHRKPLSDRVIEIIRAMEAVRVSDYVFPSWKRGRPLNSLTMVKLMRRMGHGDVTVHGTARSAFRDWAAEETNHSREAAEIALAHKVHSDVEAAYRRGDALEKRRALMRDWAAFVGTVRPDNVVQMRRAI